MEDIAYSNVNKNSTKLPQLDNKSVWAGILMFRLFLALNNQTMQHPDESYQSVDVAYD